MEEECDKKQCKLMLEPIVMEEVDDTEGSEEESNCNRLRDGTRLCEPLSAVFKPKGSWRSGEKVTHASGVWNDTEETNFLRQWCKSTPVPRILLEVLNGSGSGRHNNRGTKADRPLDWVIILCVYLIIFLFIYFTLHGENYRWHCTTSCGTCSIDGTPDDICMQHNGSGHYTFPSISTTSWHYDFIVAAVLNGMGNCTTGHANLTSSVNVPVRGLVEYSTQPVCNQDERCAVLLFGQGIGRHYGDFQTNVTASLPESCPWVSVDVIVFTGSETWHIIEATLRMILLIVSVYIVHFTSKRLRARIASKQPHLGIQRLLLGVMPFVFLTLNPFFIFAVYFHDDGTDAARFFYFMENVPPKLLIAAYSTFLLTMVSNTSRICPFPVVFNIAVDHVVPAGISETNSPVVITAEIHRECPVVMTIQNGWRAFDAMLGMNSKTCVDTLAPEEIIQMIEDSPSLWSILKIQQLTNWGAVVRSMKQEVAEPDEIPLSMMAGQQDDVEYRGITRSEFARVWSSAVNEQQSVLCPATEWLAPTSKAFSTFQFDVSELIACPLARGCSFVVKVIVDIDGMKRERRIRLTKDIQALCLTRQVVVPRPVFTVTENVAGLYSCLVAAALTIVNETAKPDVMVRVTGSLPFEEPLTIKYVMSSPQDILAVFMGMALVSTAVARFSLRDWERYRMDEYYVGTKVIFDEGNRVEESIDELVFSLWFVLAFGLLTVAWLHLKQLPYRHSRHLHLLHHGIMGLILLVVAAGVLGYVLRPVRLMEIFLWRWGEMVNLTACCLSLVLCMALCPPRVVQLDADTITKETVLQYMKETGGSRLRTFRTVADKLYIDNWLKRGCNSGQKVSTVPFGEENEDKNSAEHSKDEESVEIEPLDLHGFCLETAVSSFYASSVVYEPVLRPTVILRQHSTFSGLFEEDVVNIRKDMPRWSQLCINYPVDIFLKGRAWPSVAHYMHTMCSLSHSGIIARMVSVSETPYIAKDTASRHMDFERTANMTQQLGFMTEAIGEKFRQSSECRKILLDTGSRHIRFIDEDDPYWGCDMDGRGGNMIGSILMDVRRELNETYPLDDVLVEMRAKVQGKHTDSTDHLLALLRMQFDNYENTEARETLLSTMDKTLVNLTDRDVFWGVGENGLGENQYCILLMKLREEYRRAFEEAVPDTLKVTRNFDWIFKMFKVDAIISSEITKPSAKPAEPGHEAEPEDDMELNDMESGETKCVILSTHADYQTTFVLVSFRGTITFQNGDFDWRNVMTDCRCTQSEIQVGDETVMVHAGFADLWGRFRERVIATLVDKLSLEDEDDDTTLVFTGHSLGGALATLAAMDVAANVYKKRRITMYNFGSPRVGDKHFAELYDKLVPDSFRVVCKGDPVPMLPPMFFYTHVGHSVLMNSAGEFVVDAGFAERRILPYFNPYQHVRLLDSHRRGDTPGGEPGYLQGITNIANKFNLRSREELSHKMNMGQKYSPEWRRLWSVCSQGNPMDYEVVFLHEAMQFCGEPPPVPQRVPLNVYHSELRNDSMVAATAEQQAWAVAHGFRYMKTLGDVFTFPRGDGRSWFKGELKPLYLCYNESRKYVLN